MRKVRTGTQLNRALKDISKKTGDDFGDILAKLSIDGFRELVMRTARQTGFARSNWAVAVDTNPLSSPLKNPNSGNSYNDAKYPTVNIKGDSVVVLYNNTEYIVHLETGTPNMKAQPMVEPTYQMLLNLANQLTRQLSRKDYNV